MPGNGAIAGDDFLNSFMRGSQFVESMKRERTQDNEHAQDRQYQLQQRQQADTEHQQDRGYQMATRPSVGDVQESQQLSLDTKKVGLDSARQKLGQAQDQQKREQGSRELASAFSMLAPGAPPLDDAGADQVIATAQKHGVPLDGLVLSPKFKEANDTLGALIQGAPVSHDAVIDAFNTRFHNDINRTRGQALPNGDTIDSMQITNGHMSRDGQFLALEGNVTAKRKDGSTYTYKAPITKNRSGEPDDTVMMIPVHDVMDKVHGARLMQSALEQSPDAVEALAARMKARGIQYGADITAGASATASGGRGARGGSAGGKESAQVQYLRYVAQNEFGGDVGAARKSISSKPEMYVNKLAAQLSAQKDGSGKPMFTPAEAKQRAMETIHDFDGTSQPQADDGDGSDAASTNSKDFSGLWQKR